MVVIGVVKKKGLTLRSGLLVSFQQALLAFTASNLFEAASRNAF
jgi:hypothetical protein